MTITQTYGITGIENLVEDAPIPEPPLLRHIVWKWHNVHMKPLFSDWNAVESAEIVEVAAVRQIEIMAVCGHKWTPRLTTTGTNGLETCDKCPGAAAELQKQYPNE